MDSVTQKVGEAAIEWISRTLDLLDKSDMSPNQS
jgi:hypothetical protein